MLPVATGIQRGAPKIYVCVLCVRVLCKTRRSFIRGWNPFGEFLICYSISILPSWILSRIRNQAKTARNGNFCAWKNLTHKKALWCTCIFTIKTDYHWTCLKCRAKDKRTAVLKTPGADVSSSGKKLRKTSEVLVPLPPLLRARVKCP